MGIKHAERGSRRRCASALRDRPDLEQLCDFFARTSDERFFVKNLERVQGDERDAIILSIGYGKNRRRATARTASARSTTRAASAA